MEFSDVHLNISRNLWQYYRDELALDNNNNIIDFPGDNNHSISFKCKQQVIGNTGNGGTKMLK